MRVVSLCALVMMWAGCIQPPPLDYPVTTPLSVGEARTVELYAMRLDVSGYEKTLTKADILALPQSLQDDLWLTTQPRLGVGFASLVHLPVGASIPVGEHGRLDAELGLHVEAESLGALGAPVANMRNEIYDGFDHYKYLPYIGVGYSMPLGAKP